MNSILLKKQEELNARIVRDLLRLPENKKCFDCPTKSPFFVNVTLQTFICSRCSGLVREVGHRVKSISASKFTGPELVALEHGGNGIASKIWLSCGYNTVDTPEPESDGEVRAFMRQKYYERKWLNRELAVSHDQFVKNRINELYTEEGLPRQIQRPRRSTLESHGVLPPYVPQYLPPQQQQQQQQQHRPQQLSQRVKNVPNPLNLAGTDRVQQPMIHTAPLILNSLQPQSKMCSTSQSKERNAASFIPSSGPASPPKAEATASKRTSTPADLIFSDLAGLTLTSPSSASSALSAQPSTSPSHVGVTSSDRRATYTGGILTPNQSSTLLTPTSPSFKKQEHVYSQGQNVQPIQPTVSNSMPRTIKDSSSTSNHKRTTDLQDNNDPYSALRDHYEQERQRHQQMITAIMSTSKSAAFLADNNNNNNKSDDDDPYAALRQLTDKTANPAFHTSSISTLVPASPRQPHQQHQQVTQPHPAYVACQSPESRMSESSDGSSWQGRSYSTVNEDWVEAEPYEPNDNDDDDDEDVMTHISSITTQSTTSSTKLDPTNTGLFSDLDPLAVYKRNKEATTSANS